MMSSRMVCRYFLKADTCDDVEPDGIVGTPVRDGDGNSIGVVESYNPTSGDLLIHLAKEVYYKDLLGWGVELSSIKFTE